MENKLPAKYHTTYEKDAIPDESVVGLRVYWVVDGEARYGTILEVQHKNISIKLERRWNHRAKILLNWLMVRVASNQEPKISPPKVKINPERIELLRKAVFEATNKIPAHLTHYNESDAHRLVVAAHATSQTLQEYMASIEVMRITVQNLANELDQQIDEALAYGIGLSRLPERSDIEGRSKRKKNDDAKRKLSHVREHTRDLLVSLLVAAEPEGATSEEVVAVLCALPHNGELPITQHRVMGMLSAFSRRGEAHMIPPNKWRATNKLILAEPTDAGA